MDQQPIQPQSDSNHLQRLARHYQELVDFGETCLSEWRRDYDCINNKSQVALPDTFATATNIKKSYREESSLSEHLEDETDDLQLIQSQLDQVQEELEFYFYRYRDKECECQQKSAEINKLITQQTWLVEQMTKQSALLARMMMVIARLGVDGMPVVAPSPSPQFPSDN